MISEWISVFRGKRILLLQGPVGPFFSRLAQDLKKAEATVFKVNFNGGDWLFSPPGSINFQGSAAEWPSFFEQLVEELDIDAVLLFGDCRPLHRVAHVIAHKRGIEIGVFEEGYVRPDYITFERFGVNGHSLIPRTPLFYLNNPIAEPPRTRPLGNTFWFTAWWAVLYYVCSSLLWPFFRRYRHHRPLSILEGLPWVRSAWRKLYYKVAEGGVQERLAGPLSKRFFLVPLQVHSDAQVRVHSSFDSVKSFIQDVTTSFAKYAPAHTVLVFKHHPLDRGYRDYARLIRRHARSQGGHKRVLYIHDQHLPTLLTHARGVVVINSTVGLSAVHHGTPTKVCGNAIYNMQGLTCQSPLHAFWKVSATQRVDESLYRRFLSYTVSQTQINGSFYRRLDVPGSSTGLVSQGRLVEAAVVAGMRDGDTVVDVATAALAKVDADRHSYV